MVFYLNCRVTFFASLWKGTKMNEKVDLMEEKND